MAKCNDKLESHSAKEKFPQSDKLSAINSPHQNRSGSPNEVESDKHLVQTNLRKPNPTPIERPCAQRLWSYRLALRLYLGDFPQTMRQ